MLLKWPLNTVDQKPIRVASNTPVVIKELINYKALQIHQDEFGSFCLQSAPV